VNYYKNMATKLVYLGPKGQKITATAGTAQEYALKQAGYTLQAQPQAPAQQPVQPVQQVQKPVQQPVQQAQQPVQQYKPIDPNPTSSKPFEDLPKGALVKFSDSPDVFLTDQSGGKPTLRKLTSQQAIAATPLGFGSVVTLDSKYKNTNVWIPPKGKNSPGYWKQTPIQMGASIGGNLPFDPRDPSTFASQYGTQSASQQQATQQAQNGLVYVKDEKTGLTLQMNRQAADKKIAQGWKEVITTPGDFGPRANSLVNVGEGEVPEGMQEGDLARTTSERVYRRDLAKEQKMIGEWIKKNGTPKSDLDWRKFHDYVYDGASLGGSFEKPAGTDATDFDMESPSKVIESMPTGNKVLDEFQSFADSYLTGVDVYLNKIAQQRQALAAKELETAKGDVTDAKTGLSTAASFDPQAEFKAQLEEYKFQENWDNLSQVMIDIAKVRESMNLGIAQEGERSGPMSLGTRRQRSIEERGIAQIGALTAIAEVYQGNMNIARDVAIQSTEYLADYWNKQYKTYETLLDLAKKDVISLKAEEEQYLNLQMELVKAKEEKLEENKEQLSNLFLNNPQAAEKSGVSYLDSYEEALQKMMPYMAEEAQGGDYQFVETEDGNFIFDKDTGSYEKVAPGSLNPPSDVGSRGGQCGTWAVRQYDSIANGEGMGDSYEAKKAWVDKHGTVGVSGIRVGDLVVTNEGYSADRPYGHAFIVGAINSDGTVTAFESNYNLDEKVTKNRKISLDSPKIYGYVSGQLKPEYASETKLDAAGELELMNNYLKDEGYKAWQNGEITYEALFNELQANAKFINNESQIKRMLEDAGITPGGVKGIFEQMKEDKVDKKEAWKQAEEAGIIDTEAGLKAFKDVYGDFLGKRPGFEWFGLAK